MIDITDLWVSEWVVCAFFLYLMALAASRSLPTRRRLRVFLVGLVCSGLAIMLSQLRLTPLLQVAREWLPAIYLMQGYWLCGLFFQQPMTAVEQRLIEIDRALFRRLHVTAFQLRGPRALLEYFEFTYLLAYPFVPASFAAFSLLGARADADRFWVSILVAGFGAYGVLPWIQTRPPRTFERSGPADARGLVFRHLNIAVLDHASVQVNTFPSGHASVAVAAALSVASVQFGIGLVFTIIAVSITVATVLGRYHYAADSLLGLALGIVGWWIGFRTL